jgi:RHS repeat-associated protein
VGNTTSITDPNGAMTSYRYNAAGYVEEETDPAGRVTSYTYDTNGNVIEIEDRAGRVQRFEYDDVNRRKMTRYADGLTLQFQRDAAGRLSAIEESAAGRIELSYDAKGNLSREVTPDGTVSYVYDAAGQRVRRLAADGTTDYSYDDRGRLAEVRNGLSLVSIAYDPNGRRTAVSASNGAESRYTYDPAGQLTQIDYSAPNFTDMRSFEYDSRGRIVSISGGSLTGPAMSTQESSIGLGNRIGATDGSATVYDPEGRLTATGLRRFRWNDRGLLTSVTGPFGLTTYAYDALGRRSRKIENGVATVYVYDGLDLLSAGKADDTTYFLRGLDLDQTFTSRNSKGTNAYLTDHLGSVVGVVSAAEVVTASYDSFGRRAFQGEEPLFGFSGREHDAGDLLYLRARYYDVDLGRFLSEDPVGFGAGDTNLYRYVFNDPVGRSDPLGLRSLGLGSGGGYVQLVVPPRPPQRARFGRWKEAVDASADFLDEYQNFQQRFMSDKQRFDEACKAMGPVLCRPPKPKPPANPFGNVSCPVDAPPPLPELPPRKVEDYLTPDPCAVHGCYRPSP